MVFSLISFVHLSLEMISYFHMVSQFMWIGSPEQALVTLVWLYLAVDTSLVSLQPAPPGGLVATLFTLQQLPLSMLLFQVRGDAGFPFGGVATSFSWAGLQLVRVLRLHVVAHNRGGGSLVVALITGHKSSTLAQVGHSHMLL